MKIFNRTRNDKPTESPAAMLKRVEAEIRAEELRTEHAAKMADRRRALTETHAETIKVEAQTIKDLKTERREELIGKIVTMGPLVVISGLAVTGQYGKFATFMVAEFGSVAGTIVAGLCALALELIALLFGFYGMRALRRKDSAFGLLFAATLIAGLVAWMNFDYYGEWVGVTFGLFSFVAPFLWRTKIRSDHRDELAANGEIEKRALKLERSRWIHHPIKSYKVSRHAAWTGTRDVELAVKEWESAQRPAPVEITDIDLLEAMIQNLREDLVNGQTGDAPEIDAPKRPALTAGQNGVYRTSHPKWNEAVAMYDASLDAGEPMTSADLAREAFGTSNRVLSGQVIKYVREMRERKASERHNGSDLTTEAE